MAQPDTNPAAAVKLARRVFNRPDWGTGMGHAFALFASAAGAGWILTISANASIAAAITGVLALIGGAVAALSHITPTGGIGVTPPPTTARINPAPLVYVVIGLVVGVLKGMHMERYGDLYPDPSELSAKYQQSGLGADEISRRIFGKMYPPVANESDTTASLKLRFPSTLSDDEISRRELEKIAPSAGQALLTPSELAGVKAAAIQPASLKEVLSNAANKRVRPLGELVTDKVSARLVADQLIALSK